MATQTNLLGYFGKAIDRKKSHNEICFFKKSDRNHKNDCDACICLFVTLDKHFFNRQSNVRTCFIFQFYCIGTWSSPLPNKRPVGRPKKELSCEQLNCMLEQNHDFNALLTGNEKYNKTIANFSLITTEWTAIAISRYPVEGLPNEGNRKFGKTTY